VSIKETLTPIKVKSFWQTFAVRCWEVQSPTPTLCYFNANELIPHFEFKCRAFCLTPPHTYLLQIGLLQSRVIKQSNLLQWLVKQSARWPTTEGGVSKDGQCGSRSL